MKVAVIRRRSIAALHGDHYTQVQAYIVCVHKGSTVLACIVEHQVTLSIFHIHVHVPLPRVLYPSIYPPPTQKLILLSKMRFPVLQLIFLFLYYS